MPRKKKTDEVPKSMPKITPDLRAKNNGNTTVRQKPPKGPFLDDGESVIGPEVDKDVLKTSNVKKPGRPLIPRYISHGALFMQAMVNNTPTIPQRKVIFERCNKTEVAKCKLSKEKSNEKSSTITTAPAPIPVEFLEAIQPKEAPANIKIPKLVNKGTNTDSDRTSIIPPPVILPSQTHSRCYSFFPITENAFIKNNDYLQLNETNSFEAPPSPIVPEPEDPHFSDDEELTVNTTDVISTRPPDGSSQTEVTGGPEIDNSLIQQQISTLTKTTSFILNRMIEDNKTQQENLAEKLETPSREETSEEGKKKKKKKKRTKNAAYKARKAAHKKKKRQQKKEEKKKAWLAANNEK